MAAETLYDDFETLYTDLLNRVRESTSVTATVTLAKRFINIAVEDMHIGASETLPWAERRSHILTQPTYTTGTLSATKGSQVVTGSGTSWKTDNDFGVNNVRRDGKLLINGTTEPYRVYSVTNDTQLAITSKFIDDDVSGASYTYFEDEYDLASDFGRPIDWRTFSDGYSIPMISRTEFYRRFPRNSSPGKVKVATIIDVDDATTLPVRKVLFHNPPDEAQVIPYHYVTKYLCVQDDGTRLDYMTGNSDEPLVPKRYRLAIVLNALYHWYRDRKDDTRAQEVRAEYIDFMMRMMNDLEIGSKRPSIVPRVGPYWLKARRPWSGSCSPRYDIYDRFDRMEW